MTWNCCAVLGKTIRFGSPRPGSRNTGLRVVSQWQRPFCGSKNVQGCATLVSIPLAQILPWPRKKPTETDCRLCLFIYRYIQVEVNLVEAHFEGHCLGWRRHFRTVSPELQKDGIMTRPMGCGVSAAQWPRILTPLHSWDSQLPEIPLQGRVPSSTLNRYYVGPPCCTDRITVLNISLL